MLIGEVTGIFH